MFTALSKLQLFSTWASPYWTRSIATASLLLCGSLFTFLASAVSLTTFPMNSYYPCATPALFKGHPPNYSKPGKLSTERSNSAVGSWAPSGSGRVTARGRHCGLLSKSLTHTCLDWLVNEVLYCWLCRGSIWQLWSWPQDCGYFRAGHHSSSSCTWKEKKKNISTDMLLNKANCCHRKGIIAKIWQHVDFQLQNTI